MSKKNQKNEAEEISLEELLSGEAPEKQKPELSDIPTMAGRLADAGAAAWGYQQNLIETGWDKDIAKSFAIGALEGFQRLIIAGYKV